MADLLHSNLSFSFIFSSLSSPLNHSPHRHFSFIRFSPLNRRVSHSSSLLAKLSSDSSQFDIISRTENSDGSVSFKFGDVTEISPTVDDENEVDLARDDDGSLDDQGDVIADVQSDGMEEEFVEERLNSEFDSQSSEGFVRDALKNGSTSAAEVENSSDSVEDGVVNNGLTSTTEVENSIDSVEDDAVKNDSTSIAKVETLSDSVGDDAVKSDSTSSDELSNNSSATAAELENLSASIEDALKSDLNANATVEVENLGGTAEVELKADLTVTAEVENSSDSVEEELDSYSVSTAQLETSSDSVKEEADNDSISIAEVENSSDSVKEELDSDSISVTEVENSSESVEEQLDVDSIPIAEVENSSDSVKEELDSDSISIAEVANSSDINTAKYEKQVADNVAPTCDSSVGLMVGKSDELREASEVMSDSDKRELSNTGKARVDVMIEKAGELSEKSAQMSDDGAVESTMITETSHSVEEHVVEDFNNSVMSEQSEAEQILENEKEDIVGLVSKQLEAEPVLDQEDEDTAESMSKQLEAEPIIDEESSSVLLDGVVVLGSNKVALADHPSIAKFDEQLTRDTSDSAHPGVEASGIASSKTTSDSLNMENMSSVASSSPLSLEVNDVSPPTVSHSHDDQHSCDMSLEAWPVSEPLGLASTNIGLDSLSKEESLAPALSISSAVASLSHSLEVEKMPLLFTITGLVWLMASVNGHLEGWM